MRPHMQMEETQMIICAICSKYFNDTKNGMDQFIEHYKYKHIIKFLNEKQKNKITHLLKNKKILTDVYISKKIGCDEHTIQNQRKILNIPNAIERLHESKEQKEKQKNYQNNYAKRCADCKKEYIAHYLKSKRCPVCRSVKTQLYFVINGMRHDFVKLIKTNPSKAKKIQDELIEIEGINFKELALDGIFEKVTNKGD